LSCEQKLAIDILLDHWKRLVAHLDDDAACAKDRSLVPSAARPGPLYLQVYGLAGTGKSYILRGFKQIIEAQRQGSSTMVRVSAQSGVAAKGCGGATNHSTFGLSVKDVNAEDLDDVGCLDMDDDKDRETTQLRRLQTEHAGVEYYFVDEYGTLGARTFGEIGTNLNKIWCTPEDVHLGNKSFVFFGHHAQLPPVKDKRLYVKYFSTPNQFKQLARLQKYGASLWDLVMDQCKVVILRKQNRRTGVDADSRRLETFLTNAMDGTNTLEDWEFMNDNSLKNKPNVAAPENDCWSLKARREDVRTGNHEYICNFSRRKERPIVPLKAVSTGIGGTADDQLCCGMPRLLWLVEGCRVMLVGRNQWLAGGVVNGSIGTLYKIVYKPGQGPPDHPAVSLLIQLREGEYYGRSILSDVPNVIRVDLTTESFTFRKKHCTRTNF
jgi:hypothetical protein